MAFVASTEDNFQDATSYISLEEVSALAGPLLLNVWNEEDRKTQQNMLMEASNQIDGFFSYRGKKTEMEQVLEFPRWGSKEVPRDVKYAVLDCLAYDLENNGVSGSVIQTKIGKTETKYKNTEKELLDSKLARRLKKYKKRSMRLRWL